MTTDNQLKYDDKVEITEVIDMHKKKDWLPNWKNKPTITEMARNMKAAKPSRDAHVSRIGVWLDNYNVEGKAKPDSPKGFSSVQPKLIRKQAEWRYAPLTEPFLSTDDLFKVSPISWEDKEGAEQHSLLLNNQFSTVIDRVGFIDEYVRTAVDEGTVFVRVGWKFEEAEIWVEEPVFSFENTESKEDLLNLKNAANGLMHHKPEWMAAVEHSKIARTPLCPVFSHYTKVKKLKTICNHPTIEVVDTANLIIDPTCGKDFSKAAFVVYAFETSLEELNASGNYHDLEELNISPSTSRTSPEFNVKGDESFNFDKKNSSKFFAYEYWGYHDVNEDGNLISFVATWVGNHLIRLQENPYPDNKFPFVNVPYMPIRKSIYGEPDGALIEDNQKIIGAITRGMIDLMGRSANGQTGIRKGILDSTNKRKYDAGQDYEFNGQINPEQAFHLHKYPEIPQSAPLMIQMQNNEADSLTGVKAFSGGLTGDALGRTSAAGVRGVLDAASKRELAILRRLAKGITEIGRKIISMNAEFLEETEIIRVTNEDFVEIQRDKLFGKYDIKLTISTAEEDNAKAQELAFMLQTVGNTVGPGLTQIILADIARLRKMPALAKQIEMYVPQPDPYQEILKQLEIEKARAEIMERQAIAQERIARAQLNMSMAGTEQVKQGNLSADTDQKHLDLIEQETGVKQERELQKHAEQAKANMNLKLFEKQIDEVFPTQEVSSPPSGE